MKNLLVSVLTLVSTIVVSAGELPASVAPTKPAVVVEIQNPTYEISNARYFSNGKLLITLRKDKKLLEKVISKANQSGIEYAAQSLADAEIETSHAQVVCMMMPGPRLALKVSAHDYEQTFNRGFTGITRLVDLGNSCAFADKLAPKEEFQQRNAKSLEATIITLANEIAE